MVKQILLPILGVIVFLSVVGFITQNTTKEGIKIPFLDNTPVQKKQMQVGEKTIEVEIADNNSARSKGLSKRTPESFSTNSGMLFILPQKNSNLAFWMKDMLFPIDIIWISGETITQIDANVPVPASGTTDAQLKRYVPNDPVDIVLEVHAGVAKKNGWVVGTRAKLVAENF